MPAGRCFLFLAVAAAAAACGGAEKPPEAPSSAASSSEQGATSQQGSDDPARLLTRGECESLGQWIAEACTSQSNTRSAQIESWCSDVVRGVSEGTWASGQCAQHVHYIDAVCFRSTTAPRGLMDCDRAVER